MKFFNSKIKALLFLILIAGTFASEFENNRRRKSHHRRGRKSMKLSKRIQRKRINLRTQAIQDVLLDIWAASTSFQLEFGLQLSVGVRIAAIGTLDLKEKDPKKRQVVWESKITAGKPPSPEKILKGIIGYITKTLTATMTKWLITNIIAPVLAPIFWVLTALDAVGHVLTFVDSLLAKVTEGTLEIGAKFSYPLIGDADEKADFGLEVTNVAADSEGDAEEPQKSLLSFDVSLKMVFDKAKATETALGALLGKDEAGTVVANLNFLKDIIRGTLKVIKAIQSVKSLVGKVVKTIVVDVVYEVLTGLMEALIIAFFGQETLKTMKAWMNKLYKRLCTMITKVLGTITEGLAKVGKALGLDKFLGGVLKGAADLATGVFLLVANVVGGVFSAFQAAKEAYKKSGVLAAIQAFAVKYVQGVWAGVKALGEKIWSAVKEIGKGAVAAVVATGKAIADGAKSTWNWVKSWFRILRRLMRQMRREKLNKKRYSKYSRKSRSKSARKHRKARQHSLGY